MLKPWWRVGDVRLSQQIRCVFGKHEWYVDWFPTLADICDRGDFCIYCRRLRYPPVSLHKDAAFSVWRVEVYVRVRVFKC